MSFTNVSSCKLASPYPLPLTNPSRSSKRCLLAVAREASEKEKKNVRKFFFLKICLLAVAREARNNDTHELQLRHWRHHLAALLDEHGVGLHLRECVCEGERELRKMPNKALSLSLSLSFSLSLSLSLSHTHTHTYTPGPLDPGAPRTRSLRALPCVAPRDISSLLDDRSWQPLPRRPAERLTAPYHSEGCTCPLGCSAPDIF